MNNLYQGEELGSRDKSQSPLGLVGSDMTAGEQALPKESSARPIQPVSTINTYVISPEQREVFVQEQERLKAVKRKEDRKEKMYSILTWLIPSLITIGLGLFGYFLYSFNEPLAQVREKASNLSEQLGRLEEKLDGQNEEISKLRDSIASTREQMLQRMR